MTHTRTPAHAATRTARFSPALLLASFFFILMFVCVQNASAGKRLDEFNEARAKMHSAYAEGRILVQPKADLSDSELDARMQRKGAKLAKRLARSKTRVVNVAPGSEEAMAAALAADPEIAFAEVDRVVAPEAITPNDPYFNSAWHLTKIGANTAWEQATGEGVIVAVLDTGVNTAHPDLIGRTVAGRNIYDNNNDLTDVHNHGTWVAGTVTATTNNAIGVAAIAHNSKVMPVRISMPDGMAYLSTIASGIYWAADNGAHIANISYDGLTESSTIQNAANYMRGKGGLVVVAAGNSGTQRNISNASTLITVSATNSSDALASFSSYGNYVDVSAPGQGIWTTSRTGGYSSVSGTSFASPATAAVLALMKSANPALTPAELEQMLKDTAVDLGSPGYDMFFGVGRINAAAAVAAAIASNGGTPAPTPDPEPTPEPTPGDTTAPMVAITSPTGGNVAGTVTIHADASDNVGVTRVDFYVGSKMVGTDSTAPYNAGWDSRTVGDGVHVLTARAFDAAGNQATSSNVSVTVKNADVTPPTVAILTPGNNATVSGTVSIKISASDNQTLSQVQCIVDGKVIAVGNSTSLNCSWNTRKVAKGAHTIQAKAFDAANNTSTHSITVNVGSATSTKTSRPRSSKSRNK